MSFSHVSGKDVKDVAKIAHGYNDVAVHNNLVYAGRSSRPYTVDVIDSNTWRRLREMSPPCCSKEFYNDYNHTISVSDDRILLCCYNNKNLYVLSHSGELLQTHGRSWREATDDDIIGKTTSGKPVYRPGVLQWLWLCQVDDDGSALVADERNDRLQVMRADGTWSVVELDQAVSYQKGAVWCNGSLYAAYEGNIGRFSSP